jgi:probable HAF family extracellular repeat protein
MHDLGTLGGCCSTSTAINATGQVTGRAFMPGNKLTHAFLWDGGALRDLNDLVDPADPLKSHVKIENGSAINDAGYIVGTGFDSRKPQASPVYLLSPAAPDDLRARNVVRGNDRFVRLGWSDSFADETMFQIQRSPVMDRRCGAFTTIGSRRENVTVFRDITASPNTAYCYQLRVIRPKVVYTLSNIARIRTGP